MTDAAYLRFPHLSGDLVTFVAEDDVWVAPTTGGRAWRVSENHAPAAGPRFSPDGETIAWMSTSEGAPEVFCAPAGGGPRRRLTWWGAARTTFLGWDHDGDLLISSPSGQGAINRRVAHRLPLAGGPAQVQPWGLVGEVALEPGGPGILVSTPTNSDPAWRKRYRGGTASVLWLDADGSGEFTRLLPELTASLVSPMWTAGGRLAFVSDHGGSGQLYSLPVPAVGAPAAVPDLTWHADSDFYVRQATTDGTRVVWSSAGSLWLLANLDTDSTDPTRTAATPERLSITPGGARVGRAPRRVAAKESVVAVAPDHTARASAIQLRGTIQWLAHRDGPARLLTPPESEPVRGRLPVVLGRTGRVAWVSDAGDEDGIAVATVDGSSPTVTHGTGDIGTVLSLAATPDGAVLAAAAHDGRLFTVDAATGAVHEVTRSLDGEVRDPTFSPDSRWLAWTAPGPEPLSQIRIVELDGARPAGEALEVTPLRFSDTAPGFSEDGRHLAFLSMRSFDPVYDTVAFDMAFVAGWRPYLVPLAADTPSPFDPSGAGRTADDGPEPTTGTTTGTTTATTPAPAGDWGSGPARGEPAAAPATRVDPDGLADRIRPFPVPAGVLTGLAPVRGGFIWRREVLAGVLGDDRARLSDPETRPALERFDLATRAVTTLAAAVDDVSVSGDGTRLVLTDHDDLVVVPADRPVPADPRSPGESGSGGSDRVVLDLSRAHVDLDPATEWRQEFGEAWRRMRDNFWRADMDGVDWAGVRAKYEPLLDAIAGVDDLVDLLWEVQGELATSHAYVRAPEKKDPARRQGLLGADLSRDEDGIWRVARVLPGESSDPRARSPLAAPAVGIGAGDALVAVGGRLVDPATGPNALLVGTVDKPVSLTVRPAGASDTREVTVVPVEDETPMRYHEWVAGRRSATHELSQGRLGYVHVPDMIGSGWAQLYRDLRVESGYEGLIVDVRENRGGHTSQLVIEKIARTVVGWDLPRNMRPFRYPADAPRGPVVLVANQNSGSDGDIVNAVAQAMRIGPVVGERTWGGVVGIDGKYTLVDGIVINQPRYAGWFAGKGWGIENHGVDPDVEVVLTPHDRSAGRDPQLETAVRLAIEALADAPAAAAPPLPPPTS